MQGGGPLYSHGRGNQGAVGVIGLMFPDKPDKHLIFFTLLFLCFSILLAYSVMQDPVVPGISHLGTRVHCYHIVSHGDL